MPASAPGCRPAGPAAGLRRLHLGVEHLAGQRRQPVQRAGSVAIGQGQLGQALAGGGAVGRDAQRRHTAHGRQVGAGVVAPALLQRMAGQFQRHLGAEVAQAVQPAAGHRLQQALHAGLVAQRAAQAQGHQQAVGQVEGLVQRDGAVQRLVGQIERGAQFAQLGMGLHQDAQAEHRHGRHGEVRCQRLRLADHPDRPRRTAVVDAVVGQVVGHHPLQVDHAQRRGLGEGVLQRGPGD